MMSKRRTYHLAACVAMAMLLLGSCGHKEVTDDMADSTKLQILDLRLEKTPDDHELLAARAQVLFNLGRMREASYDINRALKADPDNLKYMILKADITFANGEVGTSYQTLEEAEKIDPDNLDLQLKMGEITFYSRDYDRSLEHLSKVTAKDPNNRTALFMKGFVYKEKGDTASAVEFLRRVCDKYPDYAPAFEELGILYSVHDNPMAIEYLNTALQIEPSNTNTLYALALFYQNRNDYENAETLYRQMLDINPASADAWHNLGYIELFHYRDYERAVEYFTKALEANPQCIEAYANRGCAYELMEKPALARGDFETALAYDPDCTAAAEGLKRIKLRIEN